ncbi:MAG: hypothetical protein II994_04835 [Lachnospiraceae bacterium]|nr:hypothetical protein [Lachnospiraceae bacterium]
MNTYDMTCPKCGATMNLNTEEEKLHCPYCNHEIMVELEDTPDEIREKEYAKSYGYHSGKYKAESESRIQRKKEARKSTKVFIITWIILILGPLFLFCLLGGAVVFLTEASRPEINPFDYIEVSFSGTDGYGELIITELVNEEIAVDEISFDVSRDDGLSVGEKVRITASSTEYRLKEEVRIYTVEGLDEYIKSLDNLTQEEMDVIHVNAENEYGSRIAELKENNLLISYKPVKMFLITDEKQANALYDVYEFNVSTISGEQTYYAVVEFRSIMLQKTEPLTIRCSWTDFSGDGYCLNEDGWNYSERVYFYGYSSLDEVRTYVTSEMESGMVLKERDL